MLKRLIVLLSYDMYRTFLFTYIKKRKKKEGKSPDISLLHTLLIKFIGGILKTFSVQ